ncbi:MAG: HAMP domain-containing protein [Candidatus Electrothrix scaldis]|nr:MAG: HAMP domain-containing protein [Candidatus Electrothrix sp. GW3-3]
MRAVWWKAVWAGRHKVHLKTDLSPMSTLLEAANDVSLRKKVSLFFLLNFMLTFITAAGLLYAFIYHGDETPRIFYGALCAILFVLLSIQAAAMLYFLRHIIRPLTEIQAASRLMADGHLETSNYVKRSDEIGSLGENINDLAVNMQEVLLFVWNHSQSSRDLLENIAQNLNFSLEKERGGTKIKGGVQKDIIKMHRNNEDLKSIVMSFSYFEIKLEDEKMVSDYQQESAVKIS